MSRKRIDGFLGTAPREDTNVKQVLQHLRNGQIEIAEVPCPVVRPGHLLIQTTRTLISAGTERMLVEFGKASLIAKARSQPDKVKQVLDKIKTDGLMPTLEAVFNRLDEPLPLGYCNAGVVLEGRSRGSGVRTRGSGGQQRFSRRDGLGAPEPLREDPRRGQR